MQAEKEVTENSSGKEGKQEPLVIEEQLFEDEIDEEQIAEVEVELEDSISDLSLCEGSTKPSCGGYQSAEVISLDRKETEHGDDELIITVGIDGGVKEFALNWPTNPKRTDPIPRLCEWNGTESPRLLDTVPVVRHHSEWRLAIPPRVERTSVSVPFSDIDFSFVDPRSRVQRTVAYFLMTLTTTTYVRVRHYAAHRCLKVKDFPFFVSTSGCLLLLYFTLGFFNPIIATVLLFTAFLGLWMIDPFITNGGGVQIHSEAS